MNDFEDELQSLQLEGEGEPEVKLPTLEEQKKIVAELKQLEDEGKLTPEVLEYYFSKFNPDNTTPIH